MFNWINGEEKSFGFLVLLVFLEFSGLFDVELLNFVVWKVVPCNLESLLPFVRWYIHLKGIYRETSLKIVFLCQIMLSNMSIMLPNLLEKRPSNLGRLIPYQSNCSVSVSGRNGCLNRFLETCCISIVIDSILCLSLRNKSITPSFF